MRTLTLKKETLTELAAAELSAVLGGSVQLGITSPAKTCLADLVSQLNCYSWHTEQC
jgi:hypothetical protein